MYPWDGCLHCTITPDNPHYEQAKRDGRLKISL